MELAKSDELPLEVGLYEPCMFDPNLAARLASKTGPIAREFFAMDRNIDRYLDVYRQAIELGPR